VADCVWSVEPLLSRRMGSHERTLSRTRTISHSVCRWRPAAPRYNNSQPWRGGWAHTFLHLYADYDRRLPNTDPEQSGNPTASVWWSAESCVRRVAALGWQNKDPPIPQSLMTMSHPGGHLNFTSHAARRRTGLRWRRRFHGAHRSPGIQPWPVPRGDIALMALGSRARGCPTLRRVEALNRHLRTWVACSCTQPRNRLRVP